MPRHERLPPRTLPVVYFAFAHLSLILAFGLLATQPALGGFFYSPRFVAAVHLVTLGWITASILGATYIVGPLALRTTVRSGWIDGFACAFTVAGAAGVVAHFWMARFWRPDEGGTYWGVASSGAVLLLGALVVGVRAWRGLASGGAPAAVRAHVALAYGNLLLAGAWGVLLAVNRETTVVSWGGQLPNVYAHAHTAALGWGTLMVAGVGYRLLPMLLPAAPPSGRVLWVSAALFEVGALGLGVTLALRHPWAKAFAVVAAGAVALFLALVLRMRLQPRPPPKKLRKPDWGVLHAVQALVYLAIATTLGLRLAFGGVATSEAMMVYGVCGLLGFLAQAVIGVGMRLLPMFSWTEAWAGGGYAETPARSPHAMSARPLQAATFLCWTAGVPALAFGLGGGGEAWTAGGAWTLLAGTVLAGANAFLVVRHAYRRPAGTR